MLNQEIVTITFFRFKGWTPKWNAFRAMGLSPKEMTQVKGLQFGKMLGSGSGNGFSIFPDLEAYGILAVWKSQLAADNFFQKHEFFQSLKNCSTELWTTYMRTAAVHGKWEDKVPFNIKTAYDPDQLVGVLTRATIYTKHLWNFWRFVPSVSRSMSEHKEGLLFSKGVGELPLIQQATFSFWENSHFMKAYAYKSKKHREVIQKTRELGWYKEELFARFHPFKTEGNWNGINPLQARLNKQTI